MKGAVFLVPFLCASCARSAQPTAAPSPTPRPAAPQVVAQDQRRAAYPKEWERPIPKGSKLALLSRDLEKEIGLLPAKDLEDRAPLPIWFRVYLRKEMPGLATSGPYQYPRTATRILQRLLDNPDSLPKP